MNHKDVKKGSPAEGSIAAFDSRRSGRRRWQLCERGYRNSCTAGSEAVVRGGARVVSPRRWFGRLVRG